MFRGALCSHKGLAIAALWALPRIPGFCLFLLLLLLLSSLRKKSEWDTIAFYFTQNNDIVPFGITIVSQGLYPAARSSEKPWYFLSIIILMILTTMNVIRTVIMTTMDRGHPKPANPWRSASRQSIRHPGHLDLFAACWGGSLGRKALPGVPLNSQDQGSGSRLMFKVQD